MIIEKYWIKYGHIFFYKCVTFWIVIDCYLVITIPFLACCIWIFGSKHHIWNSFWKLLCFYEKLQDTVWFYVFWIRTDANFIVWPIKIIINKQIRNASEISHFEFDNIFSFTWLCQHASAKRVSHINTMNNLLHWNKHLR